MQDAQGNPIVVSLNTIIQRVFNPLKDIIRTGRNAVTAFVVSSAAITASQTAQNSAGQTTIVVDSFTELAIDVNVSAITGTSPTYSIAVDRLGADNVWYQIYAGANITTPGAQSVSLGVGASTNVSFGKSIRIREIVGGTTPNVTRSISVIGK